MLRLVAYAPDGVRRFPVLRSDMVIGSAPECDLCLPYTGVAQRHARLSFDGDALRIEDLGSRRGLLVSGRKVRESALEVLDEIRLGSVTLLVEDIAPAPEKPPLPEGEAQAPAPGRMTPERMIGHLARISEWVLADTESRITSEALVHELLADFGGGALLLLLGEMEQAGVKLAVATDPLWLTHGEELLEQIREHETAAPLPKLSGGARRLERGLAAAMATTANIGLAGELAGAPAWLCYHTFTALDRIYTLIAALPGFAPDGWSPVASLRTLGQLLVFGLVHHVGWYEPILPGQGAQQDLSLDPSLVLGESAAMKRVVEQMRSSLAADVHVLLRGEPGVGKEPLARSLHLSGARRHGPFVTASCGGARPQQIEADLFGAEVAGRGGVVRREGKLLLAHGGTLFLDDVDELPLEVQARLLRFLRSREVEPAGSEAAHPVDVRLIAGSRTALEDAVARDAFRVDLHYKLSGFVIEVPPLRERREDLPLMIQSYVNRFCHETGKRLTGITVKAMSVLLNYDYPGNVAELENIIRQLVYLSPAGRPVDVSLLPERVRRASLVTGARIDATSDLDLARLVGSCEQAAIKEALRRTRGNKSHAARLLGLSRNGLAIKMERYGLKG
ncbi:MAG TPA: sigma 54-interacting transcriptional regulator [Thermoanaerobaculia bacterium]|nr:sigma 54-interacting transcriptional regulator [Thermoanaerobaculia bacterium]